MKKIIISLSMFFVTACGGQKSTITDTFTENGKLQINLWSAVDNKPMHDLINGFNNSQDKYHVNMTFKGSYTETLTSGIAAIKAGQQPHLLTVFEVGTGTMIGSKGIYKSAEEIVSKYGEVTVDSFELIPGVQAYYSDNGKLQSFPFNSSTPVMVYNKDLFKKVGITSVPKTFEELEMVLRQLKAAGITPMTSTWGSYTLVETLSSIHNTLFATHHNGLDNFKKARISMSDLHLRTFEYLKKWSDEGLYKYYGRDQAGEQPFLQQEVAITFSSSASQNALKTVGVNYGLASMPYFSDITTSPNNSTVGGASIWAFEGFTDEAYKGIAEFIKYVYSPEPMFEFHVATGYLPLTAGAYEVGVQRGQYKKDPESELPYIQFTRPMGENSKGWRMGNFVQVRTSYEEALEAMFQGKATPSEAIEMYQTRANQLLDSFELAN